MTNVDRAPLQATVCAGGDLISVNGAAKLLDQPVEDIFRDVMFGRLPVVWLGPRPYVDRAALTTPAQSHQGMRHEW